MQGKEKHNDLNDQDFTDFAWSEMSDLLDQEMPVMASPASDNKRRYGLLLLFLLIGFGSGIGTMLLLDTNNQPATIPAPQHPNPFIDSPKEIVEADNDIAQATISTSTAETDQLAKQSKKAIQIEQKIQSKIKNAIAESSAVNPSANKTLNEKNLYNNSSSVIVFNESPEKLITYPAGDQDVSKTFNGSKRSGLQARNDEIVKALDADRSNINHLALLAHQEIPLLKVVQKEVHPEMLIVDMDPSLSFGFYLGAQTRNFSGMHGVSAGWYTSSKLDDRFSLRVGLGYSMISGFQSNSIGITEPLTPAYFEPIDTNLDDYSTVASLESNQDLPLRSMHYLDLPVALDFHMSESISVLMGAKLSYLLSAKTSGYFSNNLNSSEVELLDQALYRSMKKMDVATVLGLGFYPTSKLGVELKYNHGLIDYTRDEKWHIRQLNTNKTFELSLNFLLK